MSKEKTTRQILEENLKNQKRTPLYNREALQQIKDEFEKWQKTRVRDQDRENWKIIPHTITGSEIGKGMMYTPLDVADLDYLEDLGFSGEEPYTRGIHPNMYRGKTFTMRPLPGAGSPKDQNERYKFLINQGATGINVALDLATVQMFDSDEPESRGQVGVVGVPIDCVEDMEILFKDIPIDQISVSIVTHFPRNTAILFPMYLVMAEKRGIPWNKLIGSVQNDFIMESVVRGACEFIPPKDDFRVQCDNIEFIRKEVPKWNYITLNGYNLREEGTSAVTSMSVAIANAIEIMKDMMKRGHDADWTGKRVAFFWSFGNDFFEEIACLRAVRRLWYKIMKYRFNAKDPRSMWLRCHVQTSGISLMREEPLNNIIRAAFHGLSSVLGGTQSLHVDTYDEAFSVPSERTLLPSMRTQQIIEAETQVTQVVDPLAGSFYVESLTNEIEKRILDELEEIENMGGLVEAVDTGWLHSKVASFIQREHRMIEDRTINVVGRNIYQSPDTQLPPIETSVFNEGLQQEMIAKLERLKQKRDNERVEKTLQALVDACKKGKNVMYHTIECARADATEGEMRKAFSEAFGAWRPPIYA